MAQKYATQNTNECDVNMMNVNNENSNIETVSKSDSSFSDDDNESNLDENQDSTISYLDKIDENLAKFGNEKSTSCFDEISDIKAVSSLNDVSSEESVLKDESKLVLDKLNHDDTEQEVENSKIDNEHSKQRVDLGHGVLNHDSNLEEAEIEIFKNETSVDKGILEIKTNEDQVKTENVSETNGVHTSNLNNEPVQNDSEIEFPKAIENISTIIEVNTKDSADNTVEECNNIAQLDGNESICSVNSICDVATKEMVDDKLVKHDKIYENTNEHMEDTQSVNDVHDSISVVDYSTHDEDITMEIEEKCERDAELIIFGQLPNLFDDPTMINHYFNEVWRLKAKKNVDFELDLVSSNHELKIKYNLMYDSYYLQKVSVKEKL